MIPASYLFKGAYRGAWGTPQVPTLDEIDREKAMRGPLSEAFARQTVATARPHPVLARPAQALAIALYRWSRGTSAVCAQATLARL